MPKTNKTHYGKEAKRIIKVGTNVGGFVAKIAAKNILGITQKDKNAEELTQLLGNLKGPIMKVAQILSTIPDAIPEEYAKKLSMLQAEAPSMGWLFVKRRMRTELGINWQDKFKYFDKEAIKAASLGQVHKAIEKNKSRLLACKLQYPDMLSIVEADINQLKLLFSLYKRIDKTIDTSEIQREISSRVREELDYIREQKHMIMFAKIFSESPNVMVPNFFSDISTERLLCMNFLEGKKLLEFKDKSHSIRKKLAENMFFAWYYPFYRFGLIHGDPHLGNYSADKNFKINLLDFGCVRFFQPSFVKGVIDLYFALMKNNKELAVSAYESWGFESLSKDLIEILNIWAKFLFSPLLEDKVMKMQETNSTAYGAEAASKVHKELKKIGGVKPPREFVFMDRAAIGLGSVFLHLGAELNWYKIFNELIHNFDEKEVENKQNKLLSEAKLKENL